MFDRIAELAIRRARLVLIVATVATVLLGAVGMGAFGKLVGGGFDDPSSESSRANEVIEEKFGGETNLVLLVDAPEGGVDTPEAERGGRALTAALADERNVANVVSYWGTESPALRSADGDQALVLAHVEGENKELEENVQAVVDAHTGELDGGLTVRAGGGAAVGNEMNGQVTDDLLLAEGIAIPLTLLLLLVVFGSVVAALLPLAIGVLAILGTFAQLYLLGTVTDVSILATNLTTALGLGLGIDYALLMVSRFRERLAAGASVEGAVRHTVRTAGRTVAFSAATVAAALGALMVFPQYFLRSFGYAGVGVVAIAALATLFVLPALLRVLGHRINGGRMPWVGRGRGGGRESGWGRTARAVMRRPALTALPVLAVLLVAASPLLGITFGTADERVLPENAESRRVSAALQENFEGNDDSALRIVVDAPVDAPALDSYATELAGLDGVVRVETSAGTYADGAPAGPGNPGLGRDDAQRINVVSVLTPKSDEAQDLVHDVREVASPTTAEPLVGGTDAALVDSNATIGSWVPLAATLVVLTTFALLFLFTGSVVQPVRALLLNLVSMGAALGVVTWMYQEGNLDSVFGFTAQPMDTSMVVLVFCIAFGLSMDYEVFVTSRIKELHDQGADNETAVAGGLGHTGRIVSAAAVVLAVSFFAFGTSQISFMQMFGIATGLAILIDAVAIRGVLVPAAMRVLGRNAWWAPGPLRRFHDRFGLSEGGGDEEPVPALIGTDERPAAVARAKDPSGV
ncbi:putative drug exporter of the RND superfamily [Streptomyces zhaozhouensis]|uniref:Putative drug exporter of the RND superfamily n=1 Tax=Streptomyces zhaozhouensis TaxID=1300267 RepID=A0A286DT49_9ACTN|nr:MMPL family transporter [Streptomyces zhaozhouensis]SOD61839.1 putative drug exporter of the RND superfamily [Streptomyces zhaozhouensis]